MGGPEEHSSIYLLIFTALYCFGCFAIALLRRTKKSEQVKRDGRSVIDDFFAGSSRIDDFLKTDLRGRWSGKKRFSGRVRSGKKRFSGRVEAQSYEAQSYLCISEKMIEDEMQEVFNLAAP